MTGAVDGRGERSAEPVAGNGHPGDDGLAGDALADDALADDGSPRGGPSRESDARSRAVERLLARRGVEFARVDAVGHAGDVAAVTAPAESRERLAELASEIKALGFEYVALELGRGA